MKTRVIPFAFAFLLLAGCTENTPDAQPSSSDQVMNRLQEKSLMEALRAVGMPDITHWTDKRFLKSIFEERDQAPMTYTYVMVKPRWVKFCDSRGFSLPDNASYTSPSKYVTRGSEGIMRVDQADPNAVFDSSASTRGKWVPCVDPRTHEVKPVFTEEVITTSPFPLDE